MGDSRVEWVRATYGWHKVSDEDAMRLWAALPFTMGHDARRTLLLNVADILAHNGTPGDVNKAVALIAETVAERTARSQECAPLGKPPDYSCAEEEYVANRYCDGQRRALIAEFYRWLRYWHECNGRILSPELAATIPRHVRGIPPDNGALYPDLAFAAERAGILWAGLSLIRQYQREIS